MKQTQESILLATLGGQAQVITFALDSLLAQGENIREVIVLYLSAEGSRVNRALGQLMAEFVDDHYAGRPCRLRSMPIRGSAGRINDIQSEAEALATQRMLQELIVSLKEEGYPLHVCVSGGRRMMALLLMTVAQFHLDYRDKLWHMYTPEAFQEQARHGAVMHARPEEGVRLIQVPLTPLGDYFPALRQLTQAAVDYPLSVLSRLSQAEQARCRAVMEGSTEREREALQAFAAGKSIQDVADQMGITPDTVNTYKKKILQLCRNAWPERKILNYFQLRDLFGPYFEL
ncbi:MAG: CRISPR-associated ring nuclease [Chloroflexota bacterium]